MKRALFPVHHQINCIISLYSSGFLYLQKGQTHWTEVKAVKVFQIEPVNRGIVRIAAVSSLSLVPSPMCRSPEAVKKKKKSSSSLEAKGVIKIKNKN